MMSLSTIGSGAPNVDNSDGRGCRTIYRSEVRTRQSKPGYVLADLHHYNEDGNIFANESTFLWIAKSYGPPNGLILEATYLHMLQGNISDLELRWNVTPHRPTYCICIGVVTTEPMMLDAYPKTFAVVTVDTFQDFEGRRRNSRV